MPDALLDLIRARIGEQGPLTMAEYMRLALYHPTLGFYATRAPGIGAGYATSPSLTPWFGRLLARAFEWMWRALGKPPEFTVTEVGGGAGDLAAAALGAAGGAFGEALRWRLAEPFPGVEKVQRERLAARAGQVAWVPGLPGAGPAPGCVLANEVLDNFPVHVMEVRGGRVLEVLVGLDAGRLAETPGPPLADDLTAAAATHLEDGDRFEVRPGLGEWCREAAAALGAGYLLVVDFGDVQPDFWARRPAGSLVTYGDGGLGTDPLEGPGTRDITAHVDFTDLERAAREAGFAPRLLMTQRELLDRLGAAEAAAELRRAQAGAEGARAHGEALSLLAERGRLGALGARGGLGDHLVLLAARDAPPVPGLGG